VLAPLLFCSCQSMQRGAGVSAALEQSSAKTAVFAQQTGQAKRPPRAYPVQPAQYSMPVPPTLPPSAWTGQPMEGHLHEGGGHCPHCGPGGLPAFHFTDGGPSDESWMPDGLKCPWPQDEFICDGGDLNHDVHVKQDWTVVGLDQEDTVAHFDTVDGRTEVTWSNCICIYAPRFAAVRQVSSPILHEGHERMAGVEMPAKLNIHEEKRGPKTALQPEQVIAQLGLDQVQKLRERTRGLLLDQHVRLILAADAFLPHEDLLLIQRGQFDASEKPRLAERTAAAITWTDIQAVQILIDNRMAVVGKGLSKPEVTYTYELEGKPRLRLCKIADKSEANPGEIIHFTLRFDNVGDQKIGNVTIIDNLMPRLEFVEGSAESSLKSRFVTQQQLPGDSLVLRWEIEEPLEVNQGGIVRFQARVR
jgi:uncharacterized repeat protein (TIGR01451 family)